MDGIGLLIPRALSLIILISIGRERQAWIDDDSTVLVCLERPGLPRLRHAVVQVDFDFLP